MKKLYCLSLSLLFLFYWGINAGVVILAEVPEGIKQLIDKTQALVESKIELINKQSEEKHYLFRPGSYSPHITLAYLSNKELSKTQLNHAEPELVVHLAELARRPAVDMSDGVKQSQLVVWHGKWENNYEGKNYKNYTILALELKPSKQLLDLVQDLDATLAQHSTALKRELPFVPHVTIGWLYDRDDLDATTVIQLFKTELERVIAEHKTDQSFTINSFKLSTHDKQEEVFPFYS